MNTKTQQYTPSQWLITIPCRDRAESQRIAAQLRAIGIVCTINEILPIQNVSADSTITLGTTQESIVAHPVVTAWTP